MGNGPGTKPRPSGDGPSGKLRVLLANEGPAGGFAEVHLNVDGVDLRKADGPWLPLPLAADGHGQELLQLKTGTRKPLAEGEVPAGRYDQLRFRLGRDHWVTQGPTGSKRDLAAPAEFIASGLHLEVPQGRTEALVYAFPVAQAVLEAHPGSDRWEFHPIQGVCLAEAGTGSITGRVSQAQGGAAVAGATVTAQAWKQGRPRILRTATSRADGSYLLDLLPEGRACRVVVQPGTHHLFVGPALTVARSPVACDPAVKFFPDAPGFVVLPPLPGFPTRPGQEQPVRLLRNLPAKGDKPALAVIAASRTLVRSERCEFGPLTPGIYTLQLPGPGRRPNPSRLPWQGERQLEIKAGEKVEVPMATLERPGNHHPHRPRPHQPRPPAMIHS